MFGITLSRKYRELKEQFSRKEEELQKLQLLNKDLQSDIDTLREEKYELLRYYGEILAGRVNDRSVEYITRPLTSNQGEK